MSHEGRVARVFPNTCSVRHFVRWLIGSGGGGTGGLAVGAVTANCISLAVQLVKRFRRRPEEVGTRDNVSVLGRSSTLFTSDTLAPGVDYVMFLWSPNP